ncbi:acyl-CoA thioesterase [Taibaiella sp. KBW10]|uniref:acyl-CoA thioesterase n=1 Tax=Taibaiella sp. KBW10 TaxID=2153357 RepID=UPI000F598A3F|nr:acyl-CoA thioesterase [Taibaiella sp. KBW10]RQO29897.1 acyl-CoA thioesterase [Taibaiella sp. KBW10]
MDIQHKKVSESYTIMSEIVLPNDTNTLSNLMGGRLMHWMDIAAVIVAQKHSNKPCVTVSVDNVNFHNPIRLGNVITIEGKVTRTFNSSMEIYLSVWGQDLIKQEKYLSNEAYFNFVALDSLGKPTQIPGIIPETDKEKEMYEDALRRRQLRLLLAGKLKLEDEVALKSILFPENK